MRHQIEKRLPTEPFRPPISAGVLLNASINGCFRMKAAARIHRELITMLESHGMEPWKEHVTGPEGKEIRLTLCDIDGPPKDAGLVVRVTAQISHPGIPVNAVHFLVTDHHISANYFDGNKTPLFLRYKDSARIFERQVLPAIREHFEKGGRGAWKTSLRDPCDAD